MRGCHFLTLHFCILKTGMSRLLLYRKDCQLSTCILMAHRAMRGAAMSVITAVSGFVLLTVTGWSAVSNSTLSNQM